MSGGIHIDVRQFFGHIVFVMFRQQAFGDKNAVWPKAAIGNDAIAVVSAYIETSSKAYQYTTF